ncbi:hypothetical protein BKA57DRAFT_42690 [Linnemannia elongata]|nr:hypothetical protein BKA57DRAFT_42690 [Linnemannia elongata]
MSLSVATHCSFASFLSHESPPFCTSFLFSFLLSSTSLLSIVLLLVTHLLVSFSLFLFSVLFLSLSPVLCFYFLSIYSSPTPFFHGNQRSFFPSTFNNHSQRYLFSFHEFILHLAFTSLNPFFPFIFC